MIIVLRRLLVHVRLEAVVDGMVVPNGRFGEKDEGDVGEEREEVHEVFEGILNIILDVVFGEAHGDQGHYEEGPEEHAECETDDPAEEVLIGLLALLEWMSEEEKYVRRRECVESASTKGS